MRPAPGSRLHRSPAAERVHQELQRFRTVIRHSAQEKWFRRNGKEVFVNQILLILHHERKRYQAERNSYLALDPATVPPTGQSPAASSSTELQTSSSTSTSSSSDHD